MSACLCAILGEWGGTHDIRRVGGAPMRGGGHVCMLMRDIRRGRQQCGVYVNIVRRKWGERRPKGQSSFFSKGPYYNDQPNSQLLVLEPVLFIPCDQFWGKIGEFGRNRQEKRTLPSGPLKSRDV
jgi:hypothetical protein